MKLKQMKDGFLGTDEGYNFQADYNKSKCVIVPFGIESTVSYGGGTKDGPKAIIKASHQVETTDEQTLHPIFKCGIATLEEPKIPKEPKKALELLEKITNQILTDKKFPVILGGEHSLTLAPLRAVCRHFNDVSMLHFDAHPDMRQHYHGSVHSHASVMHQAMGTLPIKRIVQVGIRNLSNSNGELEFREKLSKEGRLKTLWGWESIDGKKIAALIPTKNVYISFDIDAFDPGIMPATGTPEPGGLLWWPVVNVLKEVFKQKNIVGLDIVELAPIKGLHHPDFLAARLVYKMIGYKFFDTKIRAV